MIEKNPRMYGRLIQAIRPVLVRHYGRELADEILCAAEPVYDRFLVETPSIGGSKNKMNKSLEMALPFFAIYEASGRSLTEEMVDEMMDVVMVSRYRRIGRVLNMNRLDKPWIRRLAYRFARRIADEINAHRGKDWNNTWGIQINPEGHDHGLAVTLVGCPLADFAKAHGYMEIMPWLCGTDEKAASALHARLIRHHTVAQGHETCDYWFVGDKDTSAR